MVESPRYINNIQSLSVKKPEESVEEHLCMQLCWDMDSKDQDWERIEERYPVGTSVGTLVWVRRRNGHWWPGRVVAAHEVPRAHLLVPKSGHPVKLLGKDDASVDWYNLGKSRRIKAFRCGEFDDCIERARSFGCLRSKNREKYARRDDAILHALELEKMQSEGCERSERLFLVGTVTGLSGLPRCVLTTDGNRGNNYQKGHVDHLLDSDATMGAFLFPQATGVLKSSNLSYKCESSTSFKCENSTNKAIPRMRDLQDIGFANSKWNKPKCKGILEGPIAEDATCSHKGQKISYKNVPQEATVEEGNPNKTESCITRITSEVCSAPSLTKVSSVTVQKRKKWPDGSSADESSYKKRHRRRPLTQVMKNSSSKKVGCSGGAKSAFPLSTANCQVREATSSQEPLQQAANELRSCSEFREPDLLQNVHQSSCGMKQEECKPLADSDRSLSDFLPNYWNDNRWPLLVSTQMDLGRLLASGCTNSMSEGTEHTSHFLGMACTGSATSVNTPNFEKSDSWKFLHQGDIDLSKSVGHNNRKSQKKGIDSGRKPMRERDLSVCLWGGPIMSKWQVKRLRDVRKSSHSLRAVKLEPMGYSRGGAIMQDSELNIKHTCTRTHTGRSTDIVSSSSQQGKAKPWVSPIDQPSHSNRSWVCCVRTPKSTSLRHRVCWVDVKVQFYEPKRKKGSQIKSLYSEVMNRAVLGYPVHVQILIKPVKYEAITTTTLSGRNLLEVSSRTTVPKCRCPMRAALNQRRVNNSAAQNRGQMHRQHKSSRRSGSMSRKTRMLSSFAGDEGKTRPEPVQRQESQGAIPSDAHKGPLVTCIPVHVVFGRIREVLYRQPDENKSVAGNPEQ